MKTITFELPDEIYEIHQMHYRECLEEVREEMTEEEFMADTARAAMEAYCEGYEREPYTTMLNQFYVRRRAENLRGLV